MAYAEFYFCVDYGDKSAANTYTYDLSHTAKRINRVLSEWFESIFFEGAHMITISAVEYILYSENLDTNLKEYLSGRFEVRFTKQQDNGDFELEILGIKKSNDGMGSLFSKR
jgi:hypothetical protein